MLGKQAEPTRQPYDQGTTIKINHCGSDVACKVVFKCCWISIFGGFTVGLDTSKFLSNIHPSLTLRPISLLALYKLYHHLVTYILIHKIPPNGHFNRLFIHNVYLFICILSIKLNKPCVMKHIFSCWCQAQIVKGSRNCLKETIVIVKFFGSVGQ